ncbi:MAG: lipase maturation factor family protein, partial [Candidatus Nanohaloarchaea archaeon]
SRWLLPFTRQLLNGSEPVERLLAHDPFGDTPPWYIRILRYEYEFTSPREKRRTGDWWRASDRKVYLPPLTIEDGRLVRADRPP